TPRELPIKNTMAQSEIDSVRALLTSKPRPVGWHERRRRLDEIGSVRPVADEVKLAAVDVNGLPGEWSIAPGSDASRVLLFFHGGGYCFFFFQAEDGIRDLTVTGVQACALPI